MQRSKFSFRYFLSARAATLLLAMPCVFVAPVSAQTAPPRDQLLAEIRALREQQTQMAELQRTADTRLRALEAQLGVAAPKDAQVAMPAAALSTSAAPAAAASVEAARLKVAGDLRLRLQGDVSDDDAPNRTSSQLRGRIGASYVFNDRITLGARLVTGDDDDPNSSDAQLSNWDDDLKVGLDLAYAQLNFDALTLYGGKIPQPFTRTDLVWDGDVNPQGLAATYRKSTQDGGAVRANGLLFAVDEQTAGPDSTMSGLQLGFDSADHSGWKYELSGGYYRYKLGSLAGADSGDWRTNRRDAAGNYVSEYELLDLIGAVSWRGSNEKWPLRVVGDYVKNLGAVDDQDTGYGVDISLGRASKPGDWRFTYGYAQTDVDAVLAAFSQDNIGIATNYDLHALTVDYTPMPKTLISAIWYHYKPNDPRFAGSNAPDDWLDRFRLFFLMNF